MERNCYLNVNNFLELIVQRLSRAIEVAKRRQQNVEKRKRALQSRMNDNVIAEQNVEAEMRMAGSDGNIPEVRLSFKTPTRKHHAYLHARLHCMARKP